MLPEKMSTLYTSNSPSLSSLETHVAELSTEYLHLGIPQALKAKCRELARAQQRILVAPTLESQHPKFGPRITTKRTIWIVIKENDWTTSGGKIQEKLTELDFCLKQKVKTSLQILQTCYTFTVIARLAPKWNMISRWLLQGSDFFATTKASSIDFEVSFTASELTLAINVQKLSFSNLKVEDLGLTPIILNKFNRDPNYVINSNHITTNRCIILPNLTTGYVYSATHHLPLSDRFESYDKLRLHWKKQHGIMLPEIQHLFYQVFFGFKSRTLFSYPACCVLKGPPLVYPDRDTHLTMSSFIGDLHSRMPSICGEKLAFSTKAYNATADLYPASCSSTGMSGVPCDPLQGVLNQQSSAAASTSTLSNLLLSIPSNPLLSTLSNSSLNTPTNPSLSIPSSPSPSTLSNPLLSALGNLSDRAVGSENVDPFSSTNTQDSHVNTATKRAGLSLSGRSKRLAPMSKKFCSSSPFEGAPNTNLVDQTTPEAHHNLQVGNEVSLHPYPRQLSASNVDTALPTSSTLPSDIAQVPGHIMFKVEKSKVGDLRKWLQYRGYKNLSKKRKDDLIKMVAVCINDTGSAYP